jgi:hypothetical protein
MLRPHILQPVDSQSDLRYNKIYFEVNTVQIGKPMKLRTRSILQELNEIAEVRNTDSLIESRATNIINSAINLLESIHKHYDAESADELERRLINAIKGQDPSKFTRGVRRIAESRKQRRKLEESNDE